LSRTLIFSSILLITASAFARNNRSAVASTGFDTNPCTVTSPCRSFGTAISHTNPGGEIIALDSAGYGPFAITTDGVTISGAPGVHAAITATTSAAITISAGSVPVTLRNLVLINAAGGANDGIVKTSTANLYASDLVIRGFGTGINSQNGNLTLQRSLIQDNVNGVTVQNGGVSYARATITDSTVERSNYGVIADQQTRVAIVNCTIAENNIGVDSLATAGVGNLSSVVTLKGCVVAGMAIMADSSGGDSAVILLSDDLLAYNEVGVTSAGTSAISSFGNNTFANNSSDGSATTSIGLK